VNKSKRKVSKSYPKRRPVKGQNQVLPWALGAITLLVVLLITYNSLRKPGTEEPGTRGYEVLFGAQGSSYSLGETQYTYPDPGNQGPGQEWVPALGDPEAPVTIIEFSDIFCGHCRAFNLENLEGILDDYISTGKARYVDHFFGFPNSIQIGALDALFCAAEQGHYFEMKHTVFQSIEVDAFDLQRAARVSGLDMSQYNDCLDSGKYKAALQEMVLDDNMGVRATPTFFINGQKMEGNQPDIMRQLIEEALQEIGG
jgi:protein-disulfide isomerase